MKPFLRKLSDEELLNQTKRLATQERELLTEILWHLKEVSDRRLYSARGFSSVFDYSVKELKYSEAAAGRRIAAMRLLVEIPEIAPAIQNGTLNLSAIGSVQSFFKKEEANQGKKYTKEEKRKVLESIASKSKRECEKLLAILSPESALGPEKIKPLTESHTELRLIVNEETLKKFEKLRDLLAHQNPEGSYGKLLDLIAEMALDQVDPARKEARIQSRKVDTKKLVATPVDSDKSKSPALAISASVRRQVYLRDGGQCTYQDPKTGRTCGSTFKLEMDHIVPKALGGTSESQQLQLRCRNHNLWEAVSKLGKETMSRFVEVGSF